MNETIPVAALIERKASLTRDLTCEKEQREASLRKAELHRQNEEKISIKISEIDTLIRLVREPATPDNRLRSPSQFIRFTKEGPTADIVRMVYKQPGIHITPINDAMLSKGVKRDTSSKLVSRMCVEEILRRDEQKGLHLTEQGKKDWEASPLFKG